MKKKHKKSLFDTNKKNTAKFADKYKKLLMSFEEDDWDEELEEAYYSAEENYDYESDDAYEYGYDDAYEESAAYMDDEYYEADDEYESDEQYEAEVYEEESAYDDETEYYDDTEYYDEEDAYEEDAYDESFVYAEYDNEEAYDSDYEEYEDSDYEEYENTDYEYDDYDDYEEYPEGVLARILYQLKHWIQGMNAFDAILTVTSVVVLIAGIVLASMVFETKHMDEQVEAFAPVGMELSNVGIVGEEGLMAIANATLLAQQEQQLQVQESTQEPQSEEPVQTKARVSVSFESVERDIKIRFRNSETGELITGTVFEVILTGTNGKQLVKTDDDMDGVIYASNVRPGVFQALITSTEKYKFPTKPQEVTVKDKVEYVVINVEDEVKSEAQVDVKVEDTQQVVAKEEEVKLKDTVEWVASNKVMVAGSDGYAKIDKSTITDPTLHTSARYGRMRFDAMKLALNKTTLSLFTGNSETLTVTPQYQDSEADGVKNTYAFEWKSSDESVATVENGKVTAKKAGTATITHTVTKKTVTTTTTKQEDVVTTETVEETISIEEYDALSAEEKALYEILETIYEAVPVVVDLESETEATVESTTEQTTESEAVEPSTEQKKEPEKKAVAYRCKKTIKTVTPVDPKVETTETTETVSATCQVTVKDIQINTGKLEIAASADACNVKGTLTVKPTKLTYTMNDNSQSTISENFPTIKWVSSDASIATVDANGVVVGVKAGKVTITGTLADIKNADGSEIKASKEITINPAVALSLSLDKTSDVSVQVGKTVTLKATVTNHQKDNGVTWTSSDEKIAKVDANGVITGVAVGSVKITATTKEKDISCDKQVSASCTVTVTSNASLDKTTKLKDKNGKQVYIKNSDGKYVEAVYADYFTAKEFYLAKEPQYIYTGWQTLNGKTYYYDKNGKVVTGAQIIQGVTYNFGSDGAIQTNVNGTTFGIDVSKWNGNIDWNAVKSSGVDYVIIRCGYRGSSSGALIEDTHFKQNIKGAQAAGLKVGVYFFSQAINEVEAVKEASFAISLAKDYKLTYPIFIDTEPSGGRADKLDVATRTAVVKAFCQTVENSGYKAGIYASKTWFEKKLTISELAKYKIWLAHYAASPSYTGKIDMWQYSCKGKINGIKGNVDLNYSYLGY